MDKKKVYKHVSKEREGTVLWQNARNERGTQRKYGYLRMTPSIYQDFFNGVLKMERVPSTSVRVVIDRQGGKRGFDRDDVQSEAMMISVANTTTSAMRAASCSRKNKFLNNYF